MLQHFGDTLNTFAHLNIAQGSGDPREGTHILKQTGVWCFNESLFYKKSLNMGPIFWLSPNFLGFRMVKAPKIAAKFVKNWPIFKEKSVTMATLFCQNDP